MGEVPEDHVQDAGEAFAPIDVDIIAVNVSVPVDAFAIVGDDAVVLWRLGVLWTATLSMQA